MLRAVLTTARSTLLQAVPDLIAAVKAEIGAELDKPHEDQRRWVDASRELAPLEARWKQSLAEAVEKVFRQDPTTLKIGETGTFTLVGDDEIEAQLEIGRISHRIAGALDWELADLNARLSYLNRMQGVDPLANPVRPDKLARMAFDSMVNAGFKPETRKTLSPLFAAEVGTLAVHLYHDLNAWLITHNVLAKIDLRPLMQKSRSSTRYQQISSQSMAQAGAPAAASGTSGGASTAGSSRGDSGASSGGGGQSGGSIGDRTFGGSAPPASSFPDSFVVDGSELDGLRPRALMALGPGGETPIGDAQYVPGSGGNLWQRMAQNFRQKFAQTLRRSQLSRQVQQYDDSGFAPSAAGQIERLDREVGRPYAEADFAGFPPEVQLEAAPRIYDYREQLQEAAQSANERAVIEIVALMFNHILSDESLPAIARVLFARLQIPVLRVAVRESESFMEASHPARDFIDRLASSVAGYAGDAEVDEVLLGEMRRLVQEAERNPSGSSSLFTRLQQEFDQFLAAYGRDLREVSQVSIPLLEQTEDFKVMTVLYTIDVRRMLDDVPCDKRLRDFLLHSWVGVLSSAAARFGKDSQLVQDLRRTAVDIIWCGMPKANARERAQLVSNMPQLMERVTQGLVIAKVSRETQEKIISRLRNLLLHLMRSPLGQTTELVFDALVAKLTEMESLFDDATQQSTQYRLPLAALRSQIAAKSIPLEVLEPGDYGLPEDVSAGRTAREWVATLALGAWFHLERKDQRLALQFAWMSPRRNYLLFTDVHGTSGIITEPNTLAVLSQRGDFKPVEYESLTSRATRQALEKLGMATV